MPTPEEMRLISKTVDLLRELFKTNKIEGSIAGAAMDTYLWMMIEDNIKAGILTKKNAEFIVNAGYKTKMHLISIMEKQGD